MERKVAARGGGFTFACLPLYVSLNPPMQCAAEGACVGLGRVPRVLPRVRAHVADYNQSEQPLGLRCSAGPLMAAEAVWCCARCSSLVLLSPCWFEGKVKFRCTLASTLSVIERGGLGSHRGNPLADNGP